MSWITSVLLRSSIRDLAVIFHFQYCW